MAAAISPNTGRAGPGFFGHHIVHENREGMAILIHPLYFVTAQAAGEILGTERIDLAGQGNQPSIQGFDEC